MFGWNAFVTSLCHGCKVAIVFGVRPAELSHVGGTVRTLSPKVIK